MPYRFLIIALAVIGCLFSFPLQAAEVVCDATDPSLLVLKGSVTTDPVSLGVPPEYSPGPYTYTETLELKKASGGKGLSGRWRILRLIQDQQSSRPGGQVMSMKSTAEIMKGHTFDCTMDLVGDSFHNECTSANAYLDFVDGRIGLISTNTWIGTYSGNRATIRFGKGNQRFNPKLEGSWNPNAPPEGKRMRLTIKLMNASDGKSGPRHVFSEDAPGLLTLKYRAVVSPSEHADEVVWTVPEIGDSQVTVEPTTKRGKEITITYTGLPTKNSGFGEKWIQAALSVEDCEVSERQAFQAFFPAKASNHPTTGETLPNWFYYWAQSPAGQIGDFITPNINYAGNQYDCSDGGTPAFFNESIDPKGINICNLANRSTGPFTINYPVISSIPPYYPLRGNRTAKYIDAFASATVHEFEHLKAAWHRKHAAIPTDADQDGLVDTMEPGLGFDPSKTVTHLAAMESEIWGWATNPAQTQHFIDTMRSIIKWDEEWLAYEVQGKYKLGTYRRFDWAYPGSQWNP